MNLLESIRALQKHYMSLGLGIDAELTLRPEVQTVSDLPQEDNNEGDFRFVVDEDNYHLWDNGEWHALPQELFKDDAITQEQINAAVEAYLNEITANEEEILEEILKGVEAANGE